MARQGNLLEELGDRQHADKLPPTYVAHPLKSFAVNQLSALQREHLPGVGIVPHLKHSNLVTAELMH